MQTTKKIMSLAALAALTFLLSGCPNLKEPIDVIFLSPSADAKPSDLVSKRFHEAAPKGPNVIESAIELSEKYAVLSDEAAVLRQKNQEFATENRQLKNHLAALEAQLVQTQKELTEANDLLIEMRIELNNWKVNVLGFRDEMRDAEKAQIETLLKILNILGGEVSLESAQEKTKESEMLSEGISIKNHETSALVKSNE